MRNRGRRLGSTAVALTAFLALAATGCGSPGQIDGRKVEQLIQSELKRGGWGGAIESVKCPSGQPSRTGHTFNCTLTVADGPRFPYPSGSRTGTKVSSRSASGRAPAGEPGRAAPGARADGPGRAARADAPQVPAATLGPSGPRS